MANGKRKPWPLQGLGYEEGERHKGGKGKGKEG
jgi:hypothetical protein